MHLRPREIDTHLPLDALRPTGPRLEHKRRVHRMREFARVIEKELPRLSARRRAGASAECLDPPREVVVVLPIAFPLEAPVVWRIGRALGKRLADAQSTERRMMFPRWSVKPADPPDARVIQSMRAEVLVHEFDEPKCISLVSCFARRARKREQRLHRKGVGPEITACSVAWRVNTRPPRETRKQRTRTLDPRIVARLTEIRRFERFEAGLATLNLTDLSLTHHAFTAPDSRSPCVRGVVPVRCFRCIESVRILRRFHARSKRADSERSTRKSA